jgi:hypothetical protein
MNDDIQQLLNLRLKMMRFRFAHSPDFITNATHPRQVARVFVLVESGRNFLLQAGQQVPGVGHEASFGSVRRPQMGI